MKRRYCAGGHAAADSLSSQDWMQWSDLLTAQVAPPTAAATATRLIITSDIVQRCRHKPDAQRRARRPPRDLSPTSAVGAQHNNVLFCDRVAVWGWEHDARHAPGSAVRRLSPTHAGVSSSHEIGAPPPHRASGGWRDEKRQPPCRAALCRRQTPFTATMTTAAAAAAAAAAAQRTCRWRRRSAASRCCWRRFTLFCSPVCARLSLPLFSLAFTATGQPSGRLLKTTRPRRRRRRRRQRRQRRGLRGV